MTRKRKILLVLLAMAVLVAVSGLAWQTVGKQQAIQAEVRTARMTQIENTVPDGILSAQELLSQPVKQGGVTLHRAVYYPQAEALVCFFENEDPNRDIYPAALPNCNATILPDAYGITTYIFEDVPADALAGGVVVEMTDWQFESCKPLTFALGA